MEIIVKRNFSVADEKRAALKASEFRKSQATSEVSSLLNCIDLKQSLILCDDHARKFNAAAHHYRVHFSKKFSRVIGNCDVCQSRTFGRFFIHEEQWVKDKIAEEKYLASLRYATIV